MRILQAYVCIQDHTSTFKHPLQARSTFCLVLAGGSQIPPWSRSLRDRWTATWASLSLAWKIGLLNDHNDTLFLCFFPNVNDASHQDPSGSVVRRGTNLFWYWYWKYTTEYYWYFLLIYLILLIQPYVSCFWILCIAGFTFSRGC